MKQMYRSRNRNRLLGYDYSVSGAYFLTVCVKERKPLLSTIPVGDGSPVPQLKPYGKIVDEYINHIHQKYECVCVDKYIIMPDHIHLLISIKSQNGTGNPSPTISSVIAWFKYQTTKSINTLNKTTGSFWQRSYYDHIIRNQSDYNEAWEYIENNPKKTIGDV